MHVRFPRPRTQKSHPHSQQALTDFVSKWRTLFANVYVPCSSLASTSCLFPISLKRHCCHQTTIATLHAKWLGFNFLLWCRHVRNGSYSFFVNLKKISLACLIYYHIASSNISFIHKSQKNLTTSGFPTRHPMIDLHGNIFCQNKMLPRNSPVINRIYLLMPLYTSNIIMILSLLVPSLKADTKIISVR